MAPSPPILSLCHRCLIRRIFPTQLLRPYRSLIGRRHATTESYPSGAAEEGASTSEFQKEFKKQLKARSREKNQHEKEKNDATEGPDSKWIITAGLEIHAQLNTTRKLFSDAKTTHTAPPNTHISVFDASLPGTQPKFNPTVLLPAIRAALAFKCTIPHASRFDRKHYFYWDQPAGYQLTQFYHPLATDGHLLLFPHDGVNPTEHDCEECVRIDIQQIQLEQDTGKTIASPPNSLIDLNRVGSPLVEIITHPFDCPDAAFPALVMRKIQAILKAVDACVVGMEWGGLRADVNVSVRLRDGPVGYGQRCEIKNVASLKAVQEAVDSEARRQVAVLEGGGVIVGETRGWDAEKGVTRRLRGKEGEVDYRFMPDPDIPPVFVSRALVKRTIEGCPLLPDQIIGHLTNPPYDLKMKDAKTLMLWDEARASATELGVVWFYKEVTRQVLLQILKYKYKKSEITAANNVQKKQMLKNEKKRLGLVEEYGTLVGNWVIHELGGQLTTRNIPWMENPIKPAQMSDLIAHVIGKKINGATAKNLLSRLLDNPTEEHSVARIIKNEGLEMHPVTDEELYAIAEKVMSQQDESTVDVLAHLRDPKGLISGKKLDDKKAKRLRSWFVGKIMREMGGRVEPSVVEAVVLKIIHSGTDSGEKTEEQV